MAHLHERRPAARPEKPSERVLTVAAEAHQLLTRNLSS